MIKIKINSKGSAQKLGSYSHEYKIEIEVISVKKK